MLCMVWFDLVANYIGKTNQEIRQQVSQHRSRIRTPVLMAPLVGHYLEFKHSQSELKWTVLWFVKPCSRGGDVERILLQKEAHLILKFNSSVWAQ